MSRNITNCGFLSLLFLIVFMVGCSSLSHAYEIDEVVTTSPSWPSFTNEDGTGLYHEVMGKVFNLYDIPVRHVYSRSSRSEELVINGDADVMTCDDRATPPLVLGRFPLYVNDYYVFYRKDRIGEWKGDASIKGKEVLCQPTYYNAENFRVPVTIKEVQTGSQAVSMIVHDRSDFYVDDMTLIKQSLAESGIDIKDDRYAIEKIGRRAYFPLFNSTARGSEIMKKYNSGLERLHNSRQLEWLYKKWGHAYPGFDKY